MKLESLVIILLTLARLLNTKPEKSHEIKKKPFQIMPIDIKTHGKVYFMFPEWELVTIQTIQTSLDTPVLKDYVSKSLISQDDHDQPQGVCSKVLSSFVSLNLEKFKLQDENARLKLKIQRLMQNRAMSLLLQI